MSSRLYCVACVCLSLPIMTCYIRFSFVYSFPSPDFVFLFIFSWSFILLLRLLRMDQAYSSMSSAREWSGYWRTAGSTSVTARTTSISACGFSANQVRILCRERNVSPLCHNRKSTQWPPVAPRSPKIRSDCHLIYIPIVKKRAKKSWRLRFLNFNRSKELRSNEVLVHDARTSINSFWSGCWQATDEWPHNNSRKCEKVPIFILYYPKSRFKIYEYKNKIFNG